MDQLITRPTIAEIHLDNLAFNFNSSRAFIGTSLNYIAVVKADAYGHGSVECSKRLEAAGIDWFGIALVEEGIELRNAGILKPILCFSSFWPGQESQLLEHRITPVIYQLDRAEILDEVAGRFGTTVPIHVKVDTGMGRVGVRFDEVVDFAQRLAGLSNLRVEGIMTHFAAADDLKQNEFTNLQVRRFEDAVTIFRNHGHYPTFLDLANSPGAVAHPNSRGNMVRLGGILYGLGGDVLPRGIPAPELRPVLALKTRVALVKRILRGETVGYGRTFTAPKDMNAAILPIGYEDGYGRSLSNKGSVIVRDRLTPVIGTISMDWTVIDISEVPGVREGDEVILIGESAGNMISAEDIAALTGTISYEVTCSIGRRVPRRFI